MKRSPMRRRGRPGRAAATRRAAGGPVAIGRDSGTVTEIAALRVHVFQRSGGRCEACQDRPAREMEHARPRSRGGSDDADNCWATCIPCHRRKEAPYQTGRLLVTPLGQERFRWVMAWGTNKWTIVRVDLIRESPPATPGARAIDTSGST